MNRFFAPGGEFARIERMFSPGHFSADGRGLGDDAFVWEPCPGKTWVVTADASAEGVHYRPGWTSSERALRKALLANLSDVNAMGGRGRLVFFNLGARADWPPETYDALGNALRELEAVHGFRVSGGDTVTVPGPGFFSFTVLGEVEGRVLLRSACRPGHRIYVSGHLGGSAAGLSLLGAGREPAPGREGQSPERALIEAHLAPTPPLALGPFLASLNRDIAAIDISDGLSSEAWHLARRSGCALRLDAERIPVHPALPELRHPRARDWVLHGGEEYQLLFTGNFSAGELARMKAVFPIRDIGGVEPGEGVFLNEGGKSVPLHVGGYSHA